MRIWDVMKLALHNLMCNKTRTLLTVIIISVVSALIMTISLLGIFLFENQINIEKTIFESRGTNYAMSEMSPVEYKKYMEIVKKYDFVVDSLKIELRSYGMSTTFIKGEYENIYDVQFDENLDTKRLSFNFLDADFTYFGMYAVNAENFISEGRIWNVSDNGNNGIWLSSKFLEDIAKEGIYLKTGEVITIIIQDLSDYNSYKMMSFTVEGIYREDVFKNGNNLSYRVPAAVMSVDYVLDGFGDMFKIDGATMKYNPPEGYYDYGVVYEAMENMTNEINGAIKWNKNSERTTDRFFCSYVSEMRSSVFVYSIYLAVILFLAFMILLLCIGSVANTIIISVDKDRKFFGLMKALGLNGRGINNIVLCQSALLVAAGVAVGIIVLFFIQPVVLSLLNSMCSPMIASYALKYTVYVYVPVYLPLVTATAFFAFAILFAKSSLVKIAKQDAISTINEVA